MDELPVSEVLPGLYRAVLDAIANLEARNRRPEAAVIRTEAIKVYSRAWTADAAHRLRALRTRADRIGEVRNRTRYETVVETLGHPTGNPADLGRRPA